MAVGCCAGWCYAFGFLGCPFDSAWCLVCEVCRLTVVRVDCRCFLSFLFLGGARRFKLSPCNTLEPCTHVKCTWHALHRPNRVIVRVLPVDTTRVAGRLFYSTQTPPATAKETRGIPLPGGGAPSKGSGGQRQTNGQPPGGGGTGGRGLSE